MTSSTGPLKVSAKSSPNAVAGAIAATLRERDGVELQAVGAGAINQAIKGVAIARNYLKTNGMDAVCVPAFVIVAIGDNERTGISLQIERRPLAPEPPPPAPENVPTTSPKATGETATPQAGSTADLLTSAPTSEGEIPTTQPTGEGEIPTTQPDSEGERPTTQAGSGETQIRGALGETTA